MNQRDSLTAEKRVIKPCGAQLHIGDDEGDNHATMICGLDKGHAGKHLERYPRMVGRTASTVEVWWEGNDKTI